MKTIQSIISPKLCQYPITLLGPQEDILFVDIETTGFSARSASLYMIGCIVFDKGEIRLIQYLAEGPEEEKDILKSFIALCNDHKLLIHYNGNNFDLPFMKQKCNQYKLSEPFTAMEGIDLYKRIMPYKDVLGLENLKQKTVERFLDIDREDTMNGGQLIEVYKEYVKTKDAEAFRLIMLHNNNDMLGMLQLLPILTYADMYFQPFRVVKVQTDKYTDESGNISTELMMKLRFPYQFPKQFSMRYNDCLFTGHDNEGLLKIPVIYGTLKYFYSNYKDYYYLPAEDTAIHKSVATYVDKQHRQKATAETCYTKKESTFLPQWDIIFTPLFRESLKDKTCYFELTDEMKHSPQEFAKYALHILDMLGHHPKR